MAKKATKTASAPLNDFQSAVVNLFQKWADFNGYASRPEYWWAILFIALVSFVTAWIPFVGVIVSVVLIVPQLSLTVRRLHDMGQSGRWLWGYALLVPYIISAAIAMAMGGGVYAFATGLFGLLVLAWVIAVFVMTLLPTKKSGNKFRK